MMRRKIRLSVACVVTALMVLISVAPMMASAATDTANGLRVSPVRATPDPIVSPGQTKTIFVNVTNVTAVTANLQAIVNDFVANTDESGTPQILFDPTQYAASHSLKRFIKPISNFTLQPGQQLAVPVVISVPKGSAAGGYYGAVRFAPASSGTGPNQNVSLAGSVGSLILLKVPGDIKEQLTIASFDVRTKDHASTFFTSTKNITATVRFQNEGNIQEQPFGKILLKNRSGKILAQYEVNNIYPPGNVLPDSIRKFPVSLTKVSAFGEYKLEGNFGYGSSGQLLSASTTFYVIPLAVVITFILVVLLLVFLIFGLPRLIKAYNRRVLRKAGRH